MPGKVIETRIASVTKDKNEIILILMKDCGLVDKYDLIDLALVIKQKSGGKPALKLFDARAKWLLTKEAKDKATQMDSEQKTKARAVVVSGRIKAELLSFFQKFSKLDYPQKIFHDSNDAYLWLLSQKEE